MPRSERSTAGDAPSSSPTPAPFAAPSPHAFAPAAAAAPSAVPTATVLHAAPLFPDPTTAAAPAAPAMAPEQWQQYVALQSTSSYQMVAAIHQAQYYQRQMRMMSAQQQTRPVQDPNDYDSSIGSCISQPLPAPASRLDVASLVGSVPATAEVLDPNVPAVGNASASASAPSSSSSSSSSSAFSNEGAAVPPAADAVLADVDERTLLTRRSLSDRVTCSLLGQRYDEDGRTLCTESETATRTGLFSAGRSAGHNGTPVSVAEQLKLSKRSTKLPESALFDPTHFNTVIAGMGGSGKTTLAAMVVTRQDVLNHFYDGIAWVKLGQTKIMDSSYDAKTMAARYESYCATLRSICEHLELNPPIFEAIPPALPTEDERSRKCRIERLMDDARQDMINLLFGMTALIVLDDLWHPSDARWFSFANTPASVLRLLVTTSIQLLGGGSGELGLCSMEENIVRLKELSEREAVRLFVREIRATAREVRSGAAMVLLGDEEKMMCAVDAVKACWCHPAAIRLAARKLGNATSQEMVEQILNELKLSARESHALINRHGENTFDLVGLQSDWNMSLFKIHERTFSCELHGLVLAQALKVCFATFALAFMRSDCTRPFVPASVIKLLWNRVIIDEEHASIHLDSVKSCSSHLLEVMVRLGLLDSCTRKRRSKFGERPVYFVSYRVHDDSMLQYVFHMLQQDVAVSESEISRRLCSSKVVKRDRLTEMKKKVTLRTKGRKRAKDSCLIGQLSLVLVEQYLECEKSKAQSYPEGGSDGYVFQHLPHHMLTVGGRKMQKQALRLLCDDDFVRGRMLSMGFVNGAKAHAADVDSIVKQVSRKDRARSTLLLSNELSSIHEAMDKFLSAERASVASTQFPDGLMEDIGQAYAEIDHLLQRQ